MTTKLQEQGGLFFLLVGIIVYHVCKYEEVTRKEQFLSISRVFNILQKGLTLSAPSIEQYATQTSVYEIVIKYCLKTCSRLDRQLC